MCRGCVIWLAVSRLLKVYVGEGRAIFLAPEYISIGDELTYTLREPYLSLLFSRGIKDIILDLADCRHIDSAGVGMLGTCLAACLYNFASFKLNRVPPKHREMLEIIKLLPFFTLTDVDYSDLPFKRVSSGEGLVSLLARESAIDLDAAAAQPSSNLKVFLCHASEDKPRVRELYARLRADGFRPWLDEEDLLPGQEWEREIPKALRESDVVIVALSKRAVSKSGYVHREIGYALDVVERQPEGEIFIIPVKLEACDAPDRLNRWQWVNLYDEKGYERLLRGLKFRAGR